MKSKPSSPPSIKPLFLPRFLRGHKLFLSFLGITQSGPSSSNILFRSTANPNSANQNQQGNDSDWDSRTRNFRNNSHNLLRITRILKSLQEFDQPQLARSLLLFMLSERHAYGWKDGDSNSSGSWGFKGSLCGFYCWSFRDRRIREEVLGVVEGVLAGEEFGREEYLEVMNRGVGNGDGEEEAIGSGTTAGSETTTGTGTTIDTETGTTTTTATATATATSTASGSGTTTGTWVEEDDQKEAGKKSVESKNKAKGKGKMEDDPEAEAEARVGVTDEVVDNKEIEDEAKHNTKTTKTKAEEDIENENENENENEGGVAIEAKADETTEAKPRAESSTTNQVRVGPDGDEDEREAVSKALR